MRKTFSTLAILLSLIMVGCSQNGATPQQQPTLEFKANGIQYKFEGEGTNGNLKGAAIINDIGGHYTLYGWNGVSGGGGTISAHMPFKIYSTGTALAIGSFTINNVGSDSRLGGILYDHTVTLTANVTSVSNSKYSGTFTATLRQQGSTNTINITEGSFSNLTFYP